MFTLEARVCVPWKCELVLIGTTFPLMSSLTRVSSLPLYTSSVQRLYLAVAVGTKR